MRKIFTRSMIKGSCDFSSFFQKVECSRLTPNNGWGKPPLPQVWPGSHLVQLSVSCPQSYHIFYTDWHNHLEFLRYLTLHLTILKNKTELLCHPQVSEATYFQTEGMLPKLDNVMCSSKFHQVLIHDQTLAKPFNLNSNFCHCQKYCQE